MDKSLRNLFLILVGTAVVAALIGRVAPIPAEYRGGALTGLLTAALAGMVAFAGIAWAWKRGTQALFGTLVGGILLRMLFIAAGLLWARAHDQHLIAFTVGFFSLYFVHQILEITLFARRSKRAPQGTTP